MGRGYESAAVFPGITSNVAMGNALTLLQVFDSVSSRAFIYTSVAAHKLCLCNTDSLYRVGPR